jgi:hypothetical protein
MFMVLDMMLQDSSRYPKWCGCGRRKWKGTFRIATFWIVSPIAVTLVLAVVAGSVAKNGMSAWDTFNQNKLMSNELSRCFLCSIITVMDLLIVMQDWDFPEFNTNNDHAINLPGVGFQQCNCNLNACFNGKKQARRKSESSKVHPTAVATGDSDKDELEEDESRFKRLGIQSKESKAYNLTHGGTGCKTAECTWITSPGVDFCDRPECRVPWHHVVVTGKWFNYGIIFMVMIFDAIMTKNQIFYQPRDNGQYVDPGPIGKEWEKDTGLMAREIPWTKYVKLALNDGRSNKWVEVQHVRPINGTTPSTTTVLSQPDNSAFTKTVDEFHYNTTKT